MGACNNRSILFAFFSIFAANLNFLTSQGMLGNNTWLLLQICGSF